MNKHVTKDSQSLIIPKGSNWQCYIFASSDIVWTPAVGEVPNVFVRFMMRICFSCKWVKNA